MIPFLQGNTNLTPSFMLAFADLGSGIVSTTDQIQGATPTFTRAGATAYTRNSSGAWIGPIAANAARSYYTAAGVYLGYLAEGSRVNHFLNSNAPVTQTSPSLATGSYTLWMEGSGSVAVAANTATITGAGTATAGNPVTFSVTVLGTVNYTVTGGPPTIVQAENGAFASSYIQTAGASVTRNGDQLSLLTSPWLNTAQGTWLVSATSEHLTSGSFALLATNNAGAYGAGNGSLLRWDSTTQASYGGNGTAVSKGGATSQANHKYAGAYVVATTEQVVTLDGMTPASNSTLDFTGVNANTLQVGGITAASQPWYGAISSIRYYPTRLPNGVLQQLTT